MEGEITHIWEHALGIFYPGDLDVELIVTPSPALLIEEQTGGIGLEIEQEGVSGVMILEETSTGLIEFVINNEHEISLTVDGTIIYHPTNTYLPQVKNYLEHPNDLTDFYLGANTLISQLIIVAGSVSVLNADLLDNHHGSYYLPTTGIAYDSYRLGGNLANTYAPIANPTFIGVVTAPSIIINDLTAGYFPYKVTATGKLGDSPIFTDGTNVGIGIVPLEKLHVAGNILADGTITASDTTNNAITNFGGLTKSNYASQTTGYRVSANGEADFRYLYADELHVKSFIADLEQALAGGQIISKSVAKVAADFTIPAAGASGTLVVEEFAGFSGAVFVDGDTIRLRQFARANNTTLDVADVWGTVVYVSRDASTNPSTQTFTFTRSSTPNAGAGTGTIKTGTLALDYGTTGTGYYEVTAVDGLNGVNSPYSQFVTWTTHPATGLAIKARIGNLAGINDAAFGGPLNGYGLYADNVYLKGQIVIAGGSSGYGNISDKPTTLNAIESGTGTKLLGIEAGATVGATWGTNLSGQPTTLAGINSTEGSKLTGIAAGATNTTNTNQLTDGANLGGTATWAGVSSIPAKIAYATTPPSSGLYLTDNYIGFYNSGWKTYMDNAGNMSLGNYAGAAGLQWNQATAELNIKGIITATAGLIGGFTISSTEGLYSGSGITHIHMKPGAGYWVGADLQANAPFSVTQTGAMKALDVIEFGTVPSSARGYLQNVAIRDEDIYEPSSSSDGSGININRIGYLGADTKFRDFGIYDGKGHKLFTISGETPAIYFGHSATPTNVDVFIQGTLALSGAFGCNGATAQPAYTCNSGSLSYSYGTHGFLSDATIDTLMAVVAQMRVALFANGIIKN